MNEDFLITRYAAAERSEHDKGRIRSDQFIDRGGAILGNARVRGCISEDLPCCTRLLLYRESALESQKDVHKT